mmetsp:Transcript_50703/g.121104  ORF Transcript_50703/g.121104 Transcript_50703/m.121104 type:complete len:325 (+) Transcript_50703:46-1020(+)
MLAAQTASAQMGDTLEKVHLSRIWLQSRIRANATHNELSNSGFIWAVRIIRAVRILVLGFGFISQSPLCPSDLSAIRFLRYFVDDLRRLLQLYRQWRICTTQLLCRCDGAVLHPCRWQDIHRGGKLLVHYSSLASQCCKIVRRLVAHRAILLHLGLPLGLLHGLRLTMALGCLLRHVLQLYLCLFLYFCQFCFGNLLLHCFLLFRLLPLKTQALPLLLLLLSRLTQVDNLWKRLLTPNKDLREALATLRNPSPQNPLVLVDRHASQSIWAEHVARFSVWWLASQKNATGLHHEKVKRNLPAERHGPCAVVPEVHAWKLGLKGLL